MAKNGGYRISNKLKASLLDIDEYAIKIKGVAETSTEMNATDIRTLDSCSNQIRAIIKDILK